MLLFVTYGAKSNVEYSRKNIFETRQLRVCIENLPSPRAKMTKYVICQKLQVKLPVILLVFRFPGKAQCVLRVKQPFSGSIS